MNLPPKLQVFTKYVNFDENDVNFRVIIEEQAQMYKWNNKLSITPLPALRYCLGNSAVRFLDVIVDNDVEEIYRKTKWVPLIKNTEKFRPVMADTQLRLRNLWQEFQEFRSSEVILFENRNLLTVFLAIFLNDPYSNRIGFWKTNQDPWYLLLPPEDTILMSWTQLDRRVHRLKSGNYAISEVTPRSNVLPELSVYVSRPQDSVSDRLEVVRILRKSFNYSYFHDISTPEPILNLNEARNLILAFFNIAQGSQMENPENWDPNLVQILVDYLHTVMLLNFGGNQARWVGIGRVNHETPFTDVAIRFDA